MRRKETAMIELTEQQRQELERSGWPARVVNPKTQETFVLLRTEMYERVRAILEAEDEIADIEEMYPVVNEALDAGEAGDANSRESA
jgi:hypothetical protein